MSSRDRTDLCQISRDVLFAEVHDELTHLQDTFQLWTPHDVLYTEPINIIQFVPKYLIF
jgi:hypothetical protein